jgi:hypothetical protein
MHDWPRRTYRLPTLPSAACCAAPLQNGLTISGHINRMGLLTLPDLFRRKYGVLMEVIVSLIEVVSFTCLLAGNLVGTSLLLQFLFGLQLWMGVLISGVMMASYTIAGGLFSIAYVDIPQVKPWHCSRQVQPASKLLSACVLQSMSCCGQTLAYGMHAVLRKTGAQVYCLVYGCLAAHHAAQVRTATHRRVRRSKLELCLHCCFVVPLLAGCHGLHRLDGGGHLCHGNGHTSTRAAVQGLCARPGRRFGGQNPRLCRPHQLH